MAFHDPNLSLHISRRLIIMQSNCFPVDLSSRKWSQWRCLVVVLYSIHLLSLCSFHCLLPSNSFHCCLPLCAHSPRALASSRICGSERAALLLCSQRVVLEETLLLKPLAGCRPCCRLCCLCHFCWWCSHCPASTTSVDRRNCSSIITYNVRIVGID